MAVTDLRCSEVSYKIVRFDILGKHSETGTFVSHALLANDSGEKRSHDQVSVIHMAPPLYDKDSCSPAAHASIPLKQYEIKDIELWAIAILDEYQACKLRSGLPERQAYRQYTIYPHKKDVVDKNTGIRRYSRYSCAGFVMTAYEKANIPLLDMSSLPEIELSDLDSIYPGVRSHGSQFGLQGAGPWPVVLPGYLINALNREPDDIRNHPYAPKHDDMYYPS